MKFSNLKTKTKVLLGICSPQLFLVILGAVAGFSINSIIYTNSWVDHTRVVLAETAGIIGSAVDMETGMRGYLLAGREEFLDPYNWGEVATYERIESLQETVSDNPAQVARLRQVEQVLREWQENVTEPTIQLRRDIGDAQTMNDMADLVGEARGKRYFDRFRQQIATFVEREEILLQQRAEEFDAVFARAEQRVSSGLQNGSALQSDLETMAENENWVIHTYRVIRHANAILAAAVDMETGMRGYLLAGREEFLEPYQAGQQRFFELTSSLSETVSDNPAQVQLLAEIAQTIRDWQSNVTEPTIQLRRDIGDASTMDDMADLVGEARGKQYFDRFRQIMAEFSAEEAALMEIRKEANESTVTSTYLAIAICVGLALMLGLMLAWQIGNGIANPIKRMTDAMARLAGGDTTIEVPARGRKDEVGDMAEAVEVFKQNAIEKVQAEGKTEETRRQFEAEREAQEKIIDASIGEVVNAAVEGDLTTRIDSSDLSGVMARVGEGVNTLLETVDKGLTETVQVMGALAEGDMTRRMEGEYHGSFLRLKRDANRMAEKIAGIAGQIGESTDAVRGATDEIAAGASDLSSRTEQQASSLEETSASMEELSATVRQNADNAQQANQLAAAARDAASGGGQVVSSAVEAMGQIEDSSKKITEIVGMIDEIAFQTNLLALNAAVEAARAGEAGKGFAVVATEVRALAQRSGQASKEIKELILTSDGQVREGVGLVKKAGESLEEIVTSVKKVADIVSDIAAASQEQSSGIEEVSSAVTNMDEMTQQNAALVEETTAALHSAQSQVADLDRLVGFFKTGNDNVSRERTAPLEVVGGADNAEPGAAPAQMPMKRPARKVAAGGSGHTAADDDWQEF